MSEREPKFWSTRKDVETLSATSIAEALRDDYEYEHFADDTEVTVYGWEPLDRPKLDPDDLVEFILEWLDTGAWEEFCNPEEGTKATPEVYDAAKALCEALDKLPVWTCDIFCERRVRVGDYRRRIADRLEKK